MSTIPAFEASYNEPWQLPSRGKVGMFSLIVGESAIFTIFVVAYVFYIGKSLSGPTPAILSVPIWGTVCLLSSSFFIWLAEHAIEKGEMKKFALWWSVTIALGLFFMVDTAIEWHKLIYEEGLTIHTNLFGTTFYSLVGLHATHVVLGLIMLTLVLVFTLTGHVNQQHAERIQVLSLYWHFVDAVWVVVFTVVYILGR